MWSPRGQIRSVHFNNVRQTKLHYKVVKTDKNPEGMGETLGWNRVKILHEPGCVTCVVISLGISIHWGAISSMNIRQYNTESKCNFYL